jgi:hypothetical protein
MGEEKEILLRGNFCAYLTCRLMGDPLFPLYFLYFLLKLDVLKRLDSLVDFQVREPTITILQGCRWKICP